MDEKRPGRRRVNTRRAWLAICDLTAQASSGTIQTTRSELAEACANHGGAISLRGVTYSLNELRASGHLTVVRTYQGLTITTLKGRASV